MVVHPQPVWEERELWLGMAGYICKKNVRKCLVANESDREAPGFPCRGYGGVVGFVE